MKSLVLIISVLCTTQAFAMTSQEMRDKGCLPQRNDDGSITLRCPAQENHQLELKKGDVVREINGEPVDSPAKAMELYQSMKESRQTTIQVERDENSETN